MLKWWRIPLCNGWKGLQVRSRSFLHKCESSTMNRWCWYTVVVLKMQHWALNRSDFTNILYILQNDQACELNYLHWLVSNSPIRRQDKGSRVVAGFCWAFQLKRQVDISSACKWNPQQWTCRGIMKPGKGITTPILSFASEWSEEERWITSPSVHCPCCSHLSSSLVLRLWINVVKTLLLSRFPW